MITVQCDKCKAVTLITPETSVEVRKVLDSWDHREHYLCTTCQEEWQEFYGELDDDLYTQRNARIEEYFKQTKERLT